jgi:hypothetical protein
MLGTGFLLFATTCRADSSLAFSDALGHRQQYTGNKEFCDDHAKPAEDGIRSRYPKRLPHERENDCCWDSADDQQVTRGVHQAVPQRYSLRVSIHLA